MKNQGKSVFRYNEAAGISSLDPAYARDQPNTWACNQLYDQLVRLDRNLAVIPAIASSWKISDDGKRYRFFLRDDVCFHNDPTTGGRLVTATDFVYSFNRLLDPGVASPGTWIFRHVKMVEGIPAFRAINDTCLEIELKSAFPPFLGMLSMQYCSVVPEEAITFYGDDFRKNPVGTGPFRFKMWKDGVKLVMVRNDNYFETFDGQQLPYLDAVAISFLADQQSAFFEFVKGNIDFLSGIDPGYKDEILTRSGKLNPKYSDICYLLSEPFLNTEYLGIMVNPERAEEGSPLLDVRVRRAMNHGFDRQRMLKYLRNGVGTPGNYGIIPPGMPAFDSTSPVYGYDPVFARKLVEEAMGDGVEIRPIAIHTTSDYLDLCKYIQHELGNIGLDINIEVLPAATMRELKATAKLPVFRASWIADYPDEENYLSLFTTRNFTPAGPNYTHFSNSNYDRLYHLARGTVSDSTRTMVYRKMDRLVMGKAPVIVLYYDRVLRFIRLNVKGLETNPMNMLDLRRVRKLER
jgi:peptide/nickel transport system substrate-binding protein